MKIELELWSSAHFDAFGDFCKALGAAQKAAEADKRQYADNVAGIIGLGGIDRASSANWMPKTVVVGDKLPVSAEFAEAVREATTEAPKRERGKPAPGRARRTKEEIAEDEAADKADASSGSMTTVFGAVVKDMLDKDGQAQISANPENRVGPEDDQATAEQDVADEQAEVDANREPETPLTIEDLKAAMTLYVTKFGMPATQEDGVNIFGDALKAFKRPDGEAAWKMTLVAGAGQDALKTAIAAWTKAASAEKRYGA